MRSLLEFPLSREEARRRRLEIRDAFKDGMSRRDIMERYAVSDRTVTRALRGS